MHPTQLVSGDVWWIIYSFLSTRDLFSLWRSHPYFIETTSEILRRKKKYEYGIDLILPSSPQDSLLTTYYIVQKSNNVLTDGVYYLKSDIICDTEGDLFILRENVTFCQDEHDITVLRGTFFRMENCDFGGENMRINFPNGASYSIDVAGDTSICLEDFCNENSLPPSSVESNCRFIVTTPKCSAILRFNSFIFYWPIKLDSR